MSQEVHVLEVEVARLQAVLNRAYGEVPRGLFPGESLLGGGRDHPAPVHEGGGGVEALVDAVLPFG